MNNQPTAKQIELLKTYGRLQPSREFTYVTIHPLADETDVLARLGMTPDQCVVCDLYWAIGQRSIFVSIHGNPAAPPSVTYWFKKTDREVPYRFFVSTKAIPVTTNEVEHTFIWLANWLTSPGFRGAETSEKESRIAQYDIALPEPGTNS